MKHRAAAVALLVTVAACAERGQSADPTTSASSSPSAQASASASDSPTAAPTSGLPATLPTDLRDGRHYFRLKGVDAANLTVTVDVVQFLTGEEAEKAAAADGEEAFDYYVRNQNEQLRTLSVSKQVTVVVNTVSSAETGSTSKDHPITFAKLKTYSDQGKAQRAVFYLTLAKGLVTSIREQYLP